MIRRNRFGFLAIIVCMSLVFIPTGITLSQDKDITPEELIQKHLKSLGNPEKLKTIKNWGISGKAGVEFMLGATGKLTDGYFMCVSDGPKVGIRMQFADINYPGEYFAYDGNEVTVGHITPGQKSPIADFIFLHNATMKEGFLGGVQTTAWPLLDVGEKQPRMKLGERTIDGQEFYELEYGSPGKRAGNMTVKLYFDKENFHHRRTEYRVRVAEDLTSTQNIVSSGGGSMVTAPSEPTGRPADRAPEDTIAGNPADSIYLLVETFDNFAVVGDVTLPQRYTLEYSVEGQAATFLAKWSILNEVYANNGQVDQSFFMAQK
ncbi:MAG: hypothetical protein JXR49_21430 [Acidobacteria bacterium]|nr:hypothetical protein [Acidobacteriota bacterium]